MTERERLSQLRGSVGTVHTPVEDVMARGRRIRVRRRRMVSGSIVVSAVGALAGVLLGVGVFTGSQHGEVQIAASPTPPAAAVEAAVPTSVNCASSSGGKTLSGSGPSADVAGLPAGARLESAVGSSVATCAVPPVAQLFSAVAGNGKAVALWGPGALPMADGETTDGATGPLSSALPQAVDIHGQNGRLLVTRSTTELSWREADGTAWVLTGNGFDPADFTQLANAFDVTRPADASLSDPASFGLKSEAPQRFPAAGTTATTWRLHYVAASGDLDITITDNGVRALGSLAATLLPATGASSVTVHGTQATVDSTSPALSTVIWAESPTRTVMVSGPYGPTQLTAIANGLVIR